MKIKLHLQFPVTGSFSKLRDPLMFDVVRRMVLGDHFSLAVPHLE